MTGVELSSSFAWIFASGSSSSPHETLHSVVHAMAFPRVSDPRAREHGQDYNLIDKVTNHSLHVLLVKNTNPGTGYVVR